MYSTTLGFFFGEDMGQNGMNNCAEVSFFGLPRVHGGKIGYGRVELKQRLPCGVAAGEEHIEFVRLGKVSFQPCTSDGNLRLPKLVNVRGDFWEDAFDYEGWEVEFVDTGEKVLQGRVDSFGNCAWKRWRG